MVETFLATVASGRSPFGSSGNSSLTTELTAAPDTTVRGRARRDQSKLDAHLYGSRLLTKGWRPGRVAEKWKSRSTSWLSGLACSVLPAAQSKIDRRAHADGQT